MVHRNRCYWCGQHLPELASCICEANAKEFGPIMAEIDLYRQRREDLAMYRFYETYAKNLLERAIGPINDKDGIHPVI